MDNIKVAYCTGFWSTNIGNGFFSLGVEYALKKILGPKNVTVVSDYQTYTTGYGKRLYPDKNQLMYINSLEVDYVVLAGPVISKYFLTLWKDTLLALKERGVGYILLSAGAMKLDEQSREDIKTFFKECPPFMLVSRETTLYNDFGKYALHAYDGLCFSFFTPDFYIPSKINMDSPYWICNFDKIGEPIIWENQGSKKRIDRQFEFEGVQYNVTYSKLLTKSMTKTDRFTDAIIYGLSILPATLRENQIGKYKIIRTDQRFHPHYRRKIYRQSNSFCADLPYGYINLYANSKLTLSDRIHACAVTLAFGNSAMLFAKTNRTGLLERVGAKRITQEPVKIDLENLSLEKEKMLNWIKNVFGGNV